MISAWDDTNIESRFINKNGEVIYRIRLLQGGLWGSPGGPKYISREAAKIAYERNREKEIQYARDVEKFSQEERIRKAEADRQAAQIEANEAVITRNIVILALIVSWIVGLVLYL